MTQPWEKEKKHIPLPKDTQAFFCGNCGALSLDMQYICKPQGKQTKSDWCGIRDNAIPQFCHNRMHNVRFTCKTCGKVAVNSELLCEPEQMGKPKEAEKVKERKRTPLFQQIVKELRRFLGMSSNQA